MVYDQLIELPKVYKESIIALVSTLKDGVNIESISVFGGVAKLNLHVGSDIDLLVMVAQDCDYKKTRRGILETLSDLDIPIDYDLVTKTSGSLRKGDPFSDNLMKERIILYEKGKYTDAYQQLL